MENVDRYFTMTMSRDPGSSDDSTMGCHVGTRWTNCATKRQFVCTDATETHAIWFQTTIPNAVYETVSSNLTTSSTNYQLAQSFPFIGASTVKLQSISIVAIVNGGGSGVNFDVRIRDTTNNTIIGQATGLRSVTKSIFSVGALSNLPSSEAVFDIEIRRSGTVTADTVTIFSFVMKYY